MGRRVVTIGDTRERLVGEMMAEGNAFITSCYSWLLSWSRPTAARTEQAEGQVWLESRPHSRRVQHATGEASLTITSSRQASKMPIE